ncbi:MAG: DUF58 domain-containing protein [Planctomycetaceae bacterium]|nr:DUF58 domain-containing protein [Planctomycetaceae bacterium]MCP4462950.1 DUF58 domain-containing protein [Planctomycetaceae bacterium]MDG1808843.1 DUF58 domain-containing protein [Pirellulaceae bacterium]MDG2102899.1 DUF58 domain-containing protein [Pirellulaceae bacterium]
MPQYQLNSIDTLDSRQFAMAVKRLADSLSYGTDASPFLGSGTEYVQSRLYQPGDPVRSIDWRITARTRKFHVKEFETPKRMPCYLLIDTSASMTVSSTKRSKYATAVYMAGGLAFACLDRISPVAVLGVGETDLRYTPSLSRDKIMQWMHKLRHYNVQEQTMLTDRIRELGPLLTNHSLIIVLSDLHQPDALGPLKRLAQQHDVVALQLQDPAEASLKGAGFVRAREAESGQPLTTRGKNVGIDQTMLAQDLKRGRVDHLLIRTDQPFAYQLRHFFKSRGLLGRGAR